MLKPIIMAIWIGSIGYIATPAFPIEEKPLPLPENGTWTDKLKKFSKYQDEKLQEYHQKAVEDMKVNAKNAIMLLENKLAGIIATQAKIDKSKLTLKEEESLNAKIKVENDLMKKDILSQKEELDDLIQHFEQTGLLKNFRGIKDSDLGHAAILIDDYAAYDYKRILHWQFFAQTLIELNEFANKNRNKELYESSGEFLKKAYDIDRPLMNEIMQGASAYSLLDKGTKVEIWGSNFKYETTLVTHREKGKIRYVFNGTENDLKLAGNGISHIAPRSVFHAEWRLLLLIEPPEGNKGLFNFVGLNKGNERKFHVEIHGFEKDLQNLRSTVLPLFFDIPNLFKINDRRK